MLSSFASTPFLYVWCVFSRYIGGTRAIRRDFMRCAHLARKRTFSTSWAVFTVFFENLTRCANIALTSGKVRHGMFVVCLFIYKEQYNTLGWKFQYGYIQASDFLADCKILTCRIRHNDKRCRQLLYTPPSTCWNFADAFARLLRKNRHKKA